MTQPAKKRQLRLRVFAGPNGSGKSTVIRFVRKQKVNGRSIDFGFYVNADDIAKALTKKGVELKRYGIKTTMTEFTDFALSSGLVNSNFKKHEFLQSFGLRSNRFTLKEEKRKEYLAQIIADFLRRKLLKERKKFTFETVFSHNLP